MNARAVITGEVWAVPKQEPNKKKTRRFRDVLQTDALLGDGNAEVGRDIYLTVKGGEYNAVVMGTTARVTVRCNQDNNTIIQALETAEKLCQTAVKNYYPTLNAIVEEVANEIKDK